MTDPLSINGLGGAGGQIPFTVTSVPDIPDTPDPLASSSQNTAIYTFWQVDNIYKMRSMRLCLPIAATQPNPYANTSVFVQLAPPQCIRIVRVHAERVGAFPEFFDPENIPLWPIPPTDPTSGYAYVPLTQKYLSHVVRCSPPDYAVTPQPIYSATMNIRILMSRAPTANEQLALGNDKWCASGQVVTTPTLTNSSWSQ